MNLRWRRHPSDEDLLLASDEALPPRRLASIREHLRHCTRCRAVLGTIDDAVARYHESLPADRSAEGAWRSLRGRLTRDARTRLAASPVLASPWSRAVAAIVLAAGALVLVERSPGVRAAELLARASSIEQGTSSQAPLRLQIALRSPSRLGQVRAVASPGIQSSVASDIACVQPISADAVAPSASDPAACHAHRDLARLLDAAGLDASRPLSAAGFAAWRRRFRSSTETIDRTPDAITIATRMADGPVREGRIALNRDTFATQRIVWVFADESTIEITRGDTDAPSGGSTTAASMSHALAPGAPVLAKAPDLDAIELSARHALHDIGADLDAELTVTTRAQAVVVEGLAATTAQRDRISSTLAGLRGVDVRVRAADEVATSASRTTRAVPVGRRSMAPPLAERWLEARFADASARTRYSSAVLETASAIRRRALALDRVAARYDERRMRDMDRASQAAARRLIDRHVEGLRVAVHALEEQTAALRDDRDGGDASGCSQSARAPADSRPAIGDARRHAGLVDRLAVELFASHSLRPDEPSASESPAAALTTLACAVRQLRGALDAPR